MMYIGDSIYLTQIELLFFLTITALLVTFLHDIFRALHKLRKDRLDFEESLEGESKKKYFKYKR